MARDWNQSYAPGRTLLASSSSSCAHPGYYKLITDEIIGLTPYNTTPRSPVGSQRGKTITIYWCGYKGSPRSTALYIVYGQGEGENDLHNRVLFDISGSSGSYATVIALDDTYQSLGAFPYIFFWLPFFPLEFENGGGISFTIE